MTCCLTALLLFFAASASAQVIVVSPRAFQFESPDQTNPLNRPTSYVVEFYADGATTPTQSPSVSATVLTLLPGTSPQKYEIPLSALPSYPAGQLFTAKIRAINGAGTSDPSNASDPFGKPGRPATTSKPNPVP